MRALRHPLDKVVKVLILAGAVMLLFFSGARFGYNMGVRDERERTWRACTERYDRTTPKTLVKMGDPCQRTR